MPSLSKKNIRIKAKTKKITGSGETAVVRGLSGTLRKAGKCLNGLRHTWYNTGLAHAGSWFRIVG